MLDRLPLTEEEKDRAKIALSASKGSMYSSTPLLNKLGLLQGDDKTKYFNVAQLNQSVELVEDIVANPQAYSVHESNRGYVEELKEDFDSSTNTVTYDMGKVVDALLAKNCPEAQTLAPKVYDAICEAEEVVKAAMIEQEGLLAVVTAPWSKTLDSVIVESEVLGENRDRISTTFYREPYVSTSSSGHDVADIVFRMALDKTRSL